MLTQEEALAVAEDAEHYPALVAIDSWYYGFDDARVGTQSVEYG